MGKLSTWMPLYIADYLRDTSRLTTEGHGAYLLLIFDYWTSGRPLPDDDNQLAAIARLGVARWKQLRPVLAQFFQIEDGIWHHKRIDVELKRAALITQERSKAGGIGAAKRWQTHSKSDGKRIASGEAKSSQTDAHLPSQVEEEDSVASATGGEGPPAIPIDPVKEIWDRGLAILGKGQRSLLGKLRQTYKDPAVLAAIVACESESPSEPAAFFVACLERSKANGRYGAEAHARALDILGRAALDAERSENGRGHPEAAD
jgi:uncharacterized protein YdaU (DUF1376 family)